MRAILATVAALAIGGAAHGSELLGFHGDTPTLYSIDTNTAVATVIGNDPAVLVIADIEFADGAVYGADTGDNTWLHRIDATNGQVLSTIVMTFPPEGNVLTALEFAGTTMYAGLATEACQTCDAYLVRLDTLTGLVTMIGPTTIGAPLGGLAYDVTTGVMYAVPAGGSPGRLYTIDLSTGVATPVSDILVGGTTGVGVTALEFDALGDLYSVPNLLDPLANHLLRIDPSSGIATDLGPIAGVSGRGVASLTKRVCPADTDNNGQVDVTDLLTVLAFWGTCP